MWKPCMCPPRMVLFTPVLQGSCAQALVAFTAECSRGSFCQYQTSRLGNLTWDSELSSLWEGLCDSYFAVCGPPTWQVWHCLYPIITPLTVSMWLPICLLEQDIFVDSLSSILLKVVQQLVAFIGDSELQSFYSAILILPPYPLFFCFSSFFYSA